MFGFISASWKELDKGQQDRYSGVYCGICREIKTRASQAARMGVGSASAVVRLPRRRLDEAADRPGPVRGAPHPLRRLDWVDNEFVCYAADMNVALSYYNLMDDWQDDGKRSAKLMADAIGKSLPDIRARYPRQCGAIENCIAQLSAMEKENCSNPDEPAACFGRLMGELLTYREDMWAPTLRLMGFHLGRFIYLADAAVDYRRDKRKGKYNPYLAMGSEEDWPRWEEYLVLDMGRCTDAYEKLPLVQDKALLDNILYSGVWVNFRGKGAKAREET